MAAPQVVRWAAAMRILAPAKLEPRHIFRSPLDVAFAASPP